MITKPMLAVDAGDVSELKFPVLASPKLDGIRCLRVGGQALSRKFKPIPNNFIRTWLERYLPDGFDGELMVGKNFQDCSSGVMSVNGEPDFKYMVFDHVGEMGVGEVFQSRYNRLTAYLQAQNNPEFLKRVHLVPHVLCENEQQLREFEEWCVQNGYEGAMVRSPDGPYKNGRSTLREGYLLKMKRWVDDEGVVTGLEEQMQNTNEAEKDAFGRTKRSTHQAGMVPKDTLGAFILDWKGSVVRCGSGLNDALRKEIWQNQKDYIGKVVTFKWQPHGAKDVPRFPIFKGFRSPDDMGE